MKVDWKGLAEGVKNRYFPKKELKAIIESTSKERFDICKACEHFSENNLEKKDKNRPDEYCMSCLCNLNFKTRCLSCACPIGKWEALANVDQAVVQEYLANEKD